MREANTYSDARLRWEAQQAKLFGCRYVDGVCTVHGNTTAAPSEKSGLLCSCRSFPRPHRPEEHDLLPGRFPGDTEQQRFENRAAVDWRAEQERREQVETTADLFGQDEAIFGAAEDRVETGCSKELTLHKACEEEVTMGIADVLDSARWKIKRQIRDEASPDAGHNQPETRKRLAVTMQFMDELRGYMDNGMGGFPTPLIDAWLAEHDVSPLIDKLDRAA